MPPETEKIDPAYVRKYKKKYCKKNKTPLKTNNIFSRLFFTWLNPMLTVNLSNNHRSQIKVNFNKNTNMTFGKKTEVCTFMRNLKKSGKKETQQV